MGSAYPLVMSCLLCASRSGPDVVAPFSYEYTLSSSWRHFSFFHLTFQANTHTVIWWSVRIMMHPRREGFISLKYKPHSISFVFVLVLFTVVGFLCCVSSVPLCVSNCLISYIESTCGSFLLCVRLSCPLCLCHSGPTDICLLLQFSRFQRMMFFFLPVLHIK